jgi:CRISPR-associated exonuclease Cas4
MNTYITLSLLNDFIFCPKSIYFHGLYQKYASYIYKDTPQLRGTLKHKTIDTQSYSTHKNILQGTSIYSEKYNIGGKIDVFDKGKGALIERKTKIKTIYDGYKYQVYGQYFCLTEMGYNVKKILFHSLTNNKRYEIPLPNKKEIKTFENHLQAIRSFRVEEKQFTANTQKCQHCIYAQLCDSAKTF